MLVFMFVRLVVSLLACMFVCLLACFLFNKINEMRPLCLILRFNHCFDVVVLLLLPPLFLQCVSFTRALSADRASKKSLRTIGEHKPVLGVVPIVAMTQESAHVSTQQASTTRQTTASFWCSIKVLHIRLELIGQQMYLLSYEHYDIDQGKYVPWVTPPAMIKTIYY